MTETVALEKRTRIYLLRPKEFGMSGCTCGNNDPDWSEFMKHVWCAKCEKDFTPEDTGIFDGPIAINTARLFGIVFDRMIIETGKIEVFQDGVWKS